MVFLGSVKCGQTRRVRASFDVRAGLLSVFFRVVFRCPPAGVCFFVFSRNFFACVYVFVFQGCAVREASVLCGSGIKSLKKVMEKFGCLVCRLYFCTRFRERNAAARRSPGAGVQ